MSLALHFCLATMTATTTAAKVLYREQETMSVQFLATEVCNPASQRTSSLSPLIHFCACVFTVTKIWRRLWILLNLKRYEKLFRTNKFQASRDSICCDFPSHCAYLCCQIHCAKRKKHSSIHEAPPYLLPPSLTFFLFLCERTKKNFGEKANNEQFLSRNSG